MKFPHYVFNPLHGMTLHDRTADFLRYFLERHLARLHLTLPTEPAPYIYRTLVCEANIKMGLLSLASLAACAKKWPKIEMCVDESASPDEVKRFYGGHGIPVDVWTPADVIRRMNANGEALLRRFAETFFWGRKTAFTFGIHEKVPILYADLDILWFQDPWQGLDLQSVDTLLAAEDIGFSYNKVFMTILSPEHRELLLSRPSYCAGLYAVAPGFKLPEEVLHYISARLDAVPPGYYYEDTCAIEQTCLGLATKLKGCGIPYDILPTCPDDSTFLPSYHRRNWVAAHYAGPTRRQFWRDAWSLLKW
jgi:hypothetical protein